MAASTRTAAQSWGTPQIYCPIGQVSCIAAYFEFTLAPSGYTTFSAYIQNLQGSYTSDTTPTAIKSFVLHRTNTPPHLGGTHGLVSPINSVVSPVGNVGLGLASGFVPHQTITYDPPHNTTALSWYDWIMGEGIAGCNAPSLDHESGPIPLFEYSTCPTVGQTGWVRFDFLIAMLSYSTHELRSGLTTLNDFAFTVGNLAHGGGPGGSCTFGNNADFVPPNGTNCIVHPYALPNVAPEPATVLLLGSMLPVALGFIRARRKRR